MHELRGAAEPRLPECWHSCRGSISWWSKVQSEPHRKIEVHRVANGKPLLFPDDPGNIGIATDSG